MFNNTDITYGENLNDILNLGIRKGDRTGTGTRSIFGITMRFDLEQGFPILTTKEVHWHSVVTELLWFLRGDTNIRYLQDHNVRIWNAWANEDGNIGDMYGKQWRRWTFRYPNGGEGHIDQLQLLIDSLKNNPDSRRHLVSAWNVVELPDEKFSPQDNVRIGNMALAPCHYAFQCYVAEGKLSMIVSQRSADFFLGVPFNIASYALLTHMIAQVCGLGVGKLIWNGGDCHVYNNHVEQSAELVKRTMLNQMHSLPTLILNSDIKNIDDFKHEDIKLDNYVHEPAIKAPIAV